MKSIFLNVNDPFRGYNIPHQCNAEREEAQIWIDMNCQIVGVEFSTYAFPGGYPIFHLTKDNGVLCSKCANENISLTANDTETADPQWSIVASQANYEDHDLYCDNCGEKIEAAYEQD